MDMLQVLIDMLTVSERGNGFGAEREESRQQEELVNAAQAAAIIGVTPRRVIQLASDLDGRRCICGCGWIFPQRQVEEYARMKGLGDDGS